EVDPRIAHLGPGRLNHVTPARIGFQPPVEHPLRFALLLRNEADNVLAETARRLDRFDLGFEAVLVLIDVDLADLVNRLLNCCHSTYLCVQPAKAASRISDPHAASDARP